MHPLQEIPAEMAMSWHLLQAANPVGAVLLDPGNDNWSHLFEQSLRIVLDGFIHLQAIIGEFRLLAICFPAGGKESGVEESLEGPVTRVLWIMKLVG